MNHKHAKIILVCIIIGVMLAVFSGWFWGDTMVKFGWIGELFLNCLKMLIVPLIITAVISGISSLGDIRKLGRIGGITVSYYLVTTALSVFIGLIMVNIIRPGDGLHIEGTKVSSHISEKKDIGASDIILSLVSPNLIASAQKTQLLPIIVFSILFAAAVTTIGKNRDTVISFFNGANETMMTIVIWVMYLAPLGIFSLIAARLGKAGGGERFFAELSAVGWHVVTVLSGLAIHTIVLFSILFFITGRGVSYLSGMLRALLTAFGTASSSATLPLTMECARENNIDERAIRFTIPLGSTVNMDGTALYEAAAVMFIAQAYGLDMSIGQQAVIFITATLAAIGAAGIPEAGLVTMVIVLGAVNLPLEGIGLLLSVDWFLDRFRTSVNVWGDAVGAAVVHSYLCKDSKMPG